MVKHGDEIQEIKVHPKKTNNLHKFIVVNDVSRLHKGCENGLLRQQT